MTQEAIQQQIEALEKISAMLDKSPELRQQFLIDVGVIKAPKKKKTKTKR
jgi:hypothetical protein